MAITHRPYVEGPSQRLVPQKAAAATPALTHLLDVPALSTMGSIPEQGPHGAHQGHDQEDAKQHQDLHVGYLLDVRPLERSFG